MRATPLVGELSASVTTRASNSTCLRTRCLTALSVTAMLCAATALENALNAARSSVSLA